MRKLLKSECDALFVYDPKTGFLHWRDGDRPVATVNVASARYGRVTMRGVHYGSAQIVWTMHHGAWPERNVRRKDGDPRNDRIENLTFAAEVPSFEKQARAKRGYYAQVKDADRVHPLGRFESRDEVEVIMNLAYRGATHDNPGPNWAFIDGSDWDEAVAKAIADAAERRAQLK